MLERGARRLSWTMSGVEVRPRLPGKGRSVVAALSMRQADFSCGGASRRGLIGTVTRGPLSRKVRLNAGSRGGVYRSQGWQWPRKIVVGGWRRRRCVEGRCAGPAGNRPETRSEREPGLRAEPCTMSLHEQASRTPLDQAYARPASSTEPRMATRRRPARSDRLARCARGRWMDLGWGLETRGTPWYKRE